MYNYGRYNNHMRTGRGIDNNSSYELIPSYAYPHHPSSERFHGGVEYIQEKKDTRGTTSDNIYFNIEINNPLFTVDIANFQFDGTRIQARYEETLTQPLINNPSDYYLTVARFSIPGDGIPIIFMPIVEGQTQANRDLNPYVFTLSYNGNDYPVNVIFYSVTGVLPPNPPSLNPPNYIRANSPYYYVFSYNHMITMMNNALLTSFNALKAANPGAPPTEAPFFIFDESTGLIRLIVQRSYSPILAGAPTIEIYTNAATYYRYLSSFNVQFYAYNTVNGKDFRFIVPPENVPQFPQTVPPTPPTPIQSIYNDAFAYLNANVNGLTFSPRHYTQTVNPNPDYLVLTQEFVTLQYWNSFKSIVFTSTSLPLQAEYVPAGNIVNGFFSSTVGNSGTGVIAFKPILTDFVPLLSNAGDARTQLIYTPAGPYRLLSMVGASPIQKIDIQLFWQDQDDILHPLVIHVGKSASIKLLFIRKENIS